MLIILFILRLDSFVIDPLLKVYDARMLRSLAPIPFSAGPYFVRFHPKFSSTVFAVAQSGEFQVLDIANPHNSVQFHYVSSIQEYNCVYLFWI